MDKPTDSALDGLKSIGPKLAHASIEKYRDSKTQRATDPSSEQSNDANPSEDSPPPSYSESNNAQQSNSTRSHLSKPIIVPAMQKAEESPFLRAYPPALDQHNIPKETFLGILDTLNKLAAANPPLKYLSMTGDAMGFFPEPTMQAMGGALSAGADMSSVALNLGKTEIYLRKVNRQTFGPQGLKAEFAKLDVVAKVAGIPILDRKNKLDKNAALLAPFEDEDEMESLGTRERQMKALESYISPLELAPKDDDSDNALSGFRAKHKERKKKREEEKTVKQRKKAHSKYSEELKELQDDHDDDMKELAEEEEKAHQESDSKKKEKKLAKIGKEREKISKGFEKDKAKLEGKRMKQDKEEIVMRKMYYLLIRNKGDSSGRGPNPDVES